MFGVGFGRFYDRKLPYLSDRSQDFELESLRNLHHHNTLLSLLTETGMVGLAAFLALLAAWARSAWSLVRDAEVAGLGAVAGPVDARGARHVPVVGRVSRSHAAAVARVDPVSRGGLDDELATRQSERDSLSERSDS